MAKMPDQWYIDEAVRLYGKAQTDPVNATGKAVDVVEEGYVRKAESTALPGLYLRKDVGVSKGTAPGAWIMAWCWVPDPPGENVG